MYLNAKHIQNLRDRGFREEFIHRSGIESIEALEAAQQLAGQQSSNVRVPAMAIRYVPDHPEYAKLRFDSTQVLNPDWETSQHTAEAPIPRQLDEPQFIDAPKYLAPATAGGWPLYIRHDLMPGLNDPAAQSELWITEGEFKALACIQAGQPTIGLPGCSMWHDQEGRYANAGYNSFVRPLHDELRQRARSGRKIVLVPDNDIETKPQVMAEFMALARELDKFHVQLFITRLPTDPKRPQLKGVDDWLASGWDLEDVRQTIRPLVPQDQLIWLMEQLGSIFDVELESELRFLVRCAKHYIVDKRNLDLFLKSAARGCSKAVASLRGMAEFGTGSPERDPYRAEPEWLEENVVPLLNERYRLLREPSGAARVYSIDDKNQVVLQQDDDGARAALHVALRNRFGVIPPERVLNAGLTYWKRAGATMTSEPEPFCFLDDDRPCFARLSWRPTSGNYPAWQEFLARLSDKEAFMAFVGSCFDTRDAGRQYCYLYGQGNDGKSVVIRTIVELFGPAGGGVSDIDFKGDYQFGLAQFYGKRVAGNADSNNPKLALTATLRNVTSGDSVTINRKNQQPFSAVLRCKLFIGSNRKPVFRDLTADRSRCLLIEVKRNECLVDGDGTARQDSEWPRKLATELPAFVWACMQTYSRLCPEHSNVPLNAESRALMDEGVEDGPEAEFEEVFGDHFVRKEGNHIPAREVRKRLRHVFATDTKLGDFKEWAGRKGIYKRTKDARLYVGVDWRRQS